MQSMGDFANMSERLALMPDPALQQFAQMHKDDPFSLALAVSESNRRKKLRTAQQGVAGAQPQPPVADQEIAQMNEPLMPENVGIGALAAPNMQMPGGGITGEEEEQAPAMMAGGGMVAFAGGGDVERYQTGGSLYERYPPSNRPQDQLLFGRGPTGYENMPLSEAAKKAAAQLAGLFPTEEGVRKERARRAEEARMEALMQGYRPRASLEPGQQALAYEQAGLAPTAEQVVPPPSTPPPAGPGAGTRLSGPAGPRPSAPAAPKSVLDVFNEARRTALAEPDQFEEREKAAAAEDVGIAKELAARVKADNEKFADAYKGREERLGKRAEELAKSKDTNTGLAFLNAGLAIMSTPGGLASAIGKGARVGTEQYASGLDKLRAAQERLDDAKDRIDDLKLNRAEMSAKEVREAELGIQRAVAQGNKSLLASAKARYGDQTKLASEIAKTVVGAQEGALDRASRERIAAAPSAQERMAMLLGGNNIEKGLTRMAEISAGKFDPRKAYSEYLVAAQKTPGADLMTFSQFIGQFAIPTAPGNNPAAAPGTVRERP